MKKATTKPSILLLDIDGVINHGEMFSRRYAKKHGVPLATLSQFFDGVFQDCIVGKADLREELVHVLEEWKWKQSVDELLVYWFLDEVKYDQRILDTIHKLKKHGVKVYGASNQEHHRARYLIERTDLKDYIEEFFISAHLGVKKPDTQFFQKIMEKLVVAPSQIVYWDDDEGNVESARGLGIQSHIYKDFDIFSQQVATYFQI